LSNAKYINLLKTERIILGIDPGTTVMGFGMIKVVGNQMELILMDELLLSKYDSHSLRLKKIFDRTLSLIDEYHPDELAIEAPFFGKNVQSMLKLGRAQGVAMAAALYREIPTTEYLPKKVKMSITGNGNSSKEQVAGMLKRLLNISVLPTKLDATDGLAVAVCHFYNGGKEQGKKKYGSWKSFISDNPKKIKK
jgi:crossover junction endodeoxyribonuclease RuvC